MKTWQESIRSAIFGKDNGLYINKRWSRFDLPRGIGATSFLIDLFEELSPDASILFPRQVMIPDKLRNMENVAVVNENNLLSGMKFNKFVLIDNLYLNEDLRGLLKPLLKDKIVLEINSVE